MAPSTPSRPPSLIAHTVEVLREGLARGTWAEQLPGERALSASLHVSRPTLRAALSILEREGCIRVEQGRHRSIIRPSSNHRKPRPSKIVALLSSQPLHEIIPQAQIWSDHFHEAMARAGYEIQIHCGKKGFGRSPERELESLTTRSPAAAWLLFVSPPAMQRWFQNSRERALISGSLHPGIQLASVDFDHRATCRHAAGKFLNLGHKQLVFIRQTPTSAGDSESEAGFRHGIQNAPDTTISVAEHDGSPAGIRRMIHALLRRPQTPTGFLVARANVALAVTSELIRHGVAVPKEASVISRDTDHFLEYFTPSIARYARDPELHARSVAKALLQIAEDGASHQKKVRITPLFVPGESLGRPA